MIGRIRLALGILAVGLLVSAAAADYKKAADSATGTWESTFTTNDGQSIKTVYKLKQDGEKLTGTYKGAFGEGRVDGTVKGNAINFTVKVNAQGQDVTITYTGTIEGATMKGTVKLGDLGNGTWSGKRQ